MIFCGYFIFSDDGKSRVQLSAAVGFYVELFLCGSEPQCDVCELTNRCCSNQEYIEEQTQDSALHLIQKYKIQNDVVAIKNT